MIKKILSMLIPLGSKAVQTAGYAALYGGAATCFAAILLGLYLQYAWNIDRTKYYKMLAVAQGIDIEAQHKTADKIAEIGYEAVLERRAERNREAEFQQNTYIPQIAAEPVPELPQAEAPPVADDASKISAFEKKVKEYQAKASSAGLAEETRLLENMDAEQAKEVIRKLWKDGAIQRVLEMLLAMEDPKRGGILYAMQQDKSEELKDLCDILQRIGNGEPMTSVINEAAKAAQASPPAAK